MSNARSELDSLFRPKSIAIVGASPDARYATGLQKALEYGYDGTVYPVNPSREEVWGRACYDTIKDVPAIVDLVIVVVPREHVTDVVRDSAEIGVPIALVITAGFAEADQRGEELETELTEIAENDGIRICGPNCIGVSNMLDMVVLKAGSPPRKPEPGSIGLVSQSGALAFTTFFERAADEDIGFAYIVSTGNEADLSTTDYVEYMASDPDVDVICTYTEGIDDPTRFMEVADTATQSGTPVLSVKIGQSEFAKEATLSHTGSLVGNDDAWQAAFDQTGVERVSDIPDLLGRSSAHSAFETPDSNRVCVASTSGGLTSLLADMADEQNLDLPDVAGETEQALLNMEDLLTFGELHNPIDIRGQGAAVLPEIAEIVFSDDSFDAYVFALGIPAIGERGEDIANKILKTAELADDPVFFLWTGRKTPENQGGIQPYERVRKEIPLFYDPERCIEALASLVRFGEWHEQHRDRPSRVELRAEIKKRDEPTPELPTNQVLAWKETEALLDSYGIDVVDTEVATTRTEAGELVDDHDGAVVMKIDSPDIPHRAKADAIEIGIESGEAAEQAYDSIIECARSYDPNAKLNGVLVQPRIAANAEALVGVSQDEQFGPLVTVGTGGTLVESIDDISIRIPPFTVEDGTDAIRSTKLDEIISDNSDTPDEDVEAIAQLMQKLGTLALDVDELDELDLNPVMLHDDGVAVVDILAKTRE